ncbi:MAG: diacylglycerol kinase [Candidatus Omnitrophica bacterium]|nr:diacylglycerol kinase [Candidatus Omnitrophota bacterium]
MREHKFVESFNAAVEGFIYVLRSERNMRVHFLAAILFILLGIYLNFNVIEISILCVTISLVLVAEMVNTAFEILVDLVKSEFHPIARVIKDIAAGAVLITAVGASIVGYMLFARNLPFDIRQPILSVRTYPWQVTFMALILVFSAAIIGKLIFHKGTPLRGGMPSGHAAIAFSIWTIISFLTNNLIVIALSFVMAFLIARHRIKDAVHTLPEVLAGSILGILITVIVFQILR